MGSFSGRMPMYTCTMISAMKPTPASPCSMYIMPHVKSLNRYGLRGVKMLGLRASS